MGVLFASFYLLNMLNMLIVPVCKKLCQSEALITLFLLMISSQTFIILAFKNMGQASLFFMYQAGTKYWLHEFST